MATFKSIILKGSNHVKSDGTTNVKIRLTHNRQIAYISTDLFVLPKNFNIKQGAVKSGQNKDYINLRLTEYLQRYIKKDIELGESRDLMTIKALKDYLVSGRANSHQIDFFEFSIEFLESVTNLGTKEQYQAVIASLKSFTGDKLPISYINLQFLLRYESFLKRRGVENGIINYMRSFRSLFNKARNIYNDEDTGVIKIPQYPFAKYRMPKRKNNSKEHFLTVEELKMFINYKPLNSGEQFAKDMFLLMFYLIGIEAKDLFYLKNSKKGRINYVRFKTGTEYSIKIESEANDIIKRYKGENLLLSVSERFALNKSFTRYVNNYLQGEKAHKINGIFPKLGIHKNVTTKWARHTWATIARNDCRIDKDDVALCLGHEDADNKVTDIYIRYDYSIIDESNRKVLDLFK